MANGYEDLDKLSQEQNDILNKQETTQQDLIDKQTQMNVDKLERSKNDIDKDVNKTNQGLYVNYQKQSNQFGANAEQLAKQGLGNSGYAETTKTSLYNTYQRNVTDTLNNARDLKADVDFNISQAMQEGSVQKAQSALELYSQKLQLTTQLYELRQNREQYLYQQERDRVSDSQWQKSFDEQVRENEIENQWKQKTFDYQQSRDSVADNQWERQYELSKKAKASSSSSKKSSKKSSKSGSSSITPTTSQTQEQNNQEQATQDSTFAVIAEKILNFSKPNSKGRQIMLQGLVKAGTLTQDEANKLVSAT